MQIQESGINHQNNVFDVKCIKKLSKFNIPVRPRPQGSMSTSQPRSFCFRSFVYIIGYVKNLLYQDNYLKPISFRKKPDLE